MWGVYGICLLWVRVRSIVWCLTLVVRVLSLIWKAVIKVWEKGRYEIREMSSSTHLKRCGRVIKKSMCYCKIFHISKINLFAHLWASVIFLFFLQYENQMNVLGTWTSKGLPRPSWSNPRGDVRAILLACDLDFFWISLHQLGFLGLSFEYCNHDTYAH